jgi:hypothetical protein
MKRYPQERQKGMYKNWWTNLSSPMTHRHSDLSNAVHFDRVDQPVALLKVSFLYG